MANNDYTNLSSITIVNTKIANSIPMTDAGSKTGPEASDPAYLSSDIVFPFYGTNVQQVLKAGDTIIVKPTSSTEKAFYVEVASELNMSSSVLEVTLDKDTISADLSEDITITATPSDDSVTYSWTKSDEDGVIGDLSGDDTATVTATTDSTKEGTATITCTITDSNGLTASAVCTVTVADKG